MNGGSQAMDDPLQWGVVTARFERRDTLSRFDRIVPVSIGWQERRGRTP